MKIDEIIPGMIGILIFGVPNGFLVRLCWLAFLSRGWPSTPGYVFRSKVIPGKRRPTRASYDIHYQYNVNGCQYKGDRVRFGGFLNFNRSDAGKTVQTYPADKYVTVYYHPQYPEISTLEQRVSGTVWMWLAIGLFVVVSIAGALAGWWH